MKWGSNHDIATFCLQRCQSVLSKNPEIVVKFLKMHFCLYFCTEASEQNFLKSGNFLKTGISVSIQNGRMYVEKLDVIKLGQVND